MKTKEKENSTKDQLPNNLSWLKDSPLKKKKNYQKIKERELFLYFSANSFFKNNHYVNNLVNGRLFTSQKYLKNYFYY